MLPDKLNRYLLLCIFALVTVMSGGTASAAVWESKGAVHSVKNVNDKHNDSFARHFDNPSAENAIHCIISDHHEHSEKQCNQSSSQGGCSHNLCGGGVVGVLFSSFFAVSDFSYPQRFDCLVCIETQGHPSSPYRPPIA